MAPKSRELTRQDICELLEYDENTGFLYYKQRDEKWFGHCSNSSLACLRWNRRFAGARCGHHKRPNGYFSANLVGQYLSTHRLVWMMFNDGNPEQIDHINGIRGDNRRENLRPATHIENGRNQQMPSSNTSGRIGVSWHRSTQRWVAYIRVSDRLLHLGTFDDKAQAIEARRLAELKYGFHPNHGRPSVAASVSRRRAAL